MSPADYTLISAEVAVISLAIYAIVGQAVKPGIRLLSPAGRLSSRRYAAHRWIVRVLALLLGVVAGYLPIWPSWMLPAWGPILGVVAGSLCMPMHRAVKAALPDAVARVLTGGSVSDGEE